MEYFESHLDEGFKSMLSSIRHRLSLIEGKDKESIYAEFKEWLEGDSYDQYEVWSIPDLSDEGLCDFFRRAISQKH